MRSNRFFSPKYYIQGQRSSYSVFILFIFADYFDLRKSLFINAGISYIYAHLLPVLYAGNFLTSSFQVWAPKILIGG